jgi:hypothetical protein
MFTSESELDQTVADQDNFSAMQLEIFANRRTGDITANFSYTDPKFQAGDTVILRYDVVRSDSTAPVKCSELRFKRAVTLAGLGEKGTFNGHIDPAKFLQPLGKHPRGEAKADMDALLSEAPQLRVEGCFVSPSSEETLVASATIAGQSVPGMNLAGDEPDIVKYGKVCAQKLGAIPAFSCLDEEIFKVIPIDVTDANGKTTAADERVETCDRPVYLPTGGGYCKPWARIGRLKTGPDSQAAIVCRRYWSSSYPEIKGINDPVFNDVAIIQHNSKTGETCWFQALGVLYGDRVPPPTEVELPQDVQDEHPQAKPSEDFWLEPEEVAGINCIGCHDADPWMRSPYVAVPKDEKGNIWLPSSPASDYVMLGGEFGFKDWPISYEVIPEKNEDCVTCHRIGSLNGCETWGPDAGGVGNFLASFKTEFGKSFPNSHWMPTEDWDSYDDVSSWKDGIGEGHQAFMDCCNVKRADGTKILGKTGEFQGLEPNYGSGFMSDEDLATLAAAGCQVKQVSSVVMTPTPNAVAPQNAIQPNPNEGVGNGSRTGLHRSPGADEAADQRREAERHRRHQQRHQN